ncbi:MAG TPA: hypothetical protein VII69_02175 [Candidatus Eremiobacteraceae bacterium]
MIGRFSISSHTLSRYALPSGYTAPLGIALGKLCPDLNHAQRAGSL